MASECEGELPKNIEIPSLANLIKQEDIDMLELLPTYIIPWQARAVYESSERHKPNFAYIEVIWDSVHRQKYYLNLDTPFVVSESILKAAILLDMRLQIAFITYYMNMREDMTRDKYLCQPDIINACLESCDGQCMFLLETILQRGNANSNGKVLAKIDDFMDIDKTQTVCVEYKMHNHRVMSFFYFHKSGFAMQYVKYSDLPKYEISDPSIVDEIQKFHSRRQKLLYQNLSVMHEMSMLSRITSIQIHIFTNTHYIVFYPDSTIATGDRSDIYGVEGYCPIVYKPTSRIVYTGLLDFHYMP